MKSLEVLGHLPYSHITAIYHKRKDFMLISLFGGIFDDLILHPLAMDLVEDNDIVNILTFSKIKVLPDLDMYGASEIV